MNGRSIPRSGSAISDAHIERWKQSFTDEELIELGTFMAFADGFGKLVEMLGRPGGRPRGLRRRAGLAPPRIQHVGYR
ncbi:MAG TPA: hypothetical protein VEW91_11990, partial [bacterium]|nr:hypothetical protein [bacterium]